MMVGEIQKLREELKHLSKDNTALTGIILFAIGVAILASVLSPLPSSGAGGLSAGILMGLGLYLTIREANKVDTN